MAIPVNDNFANRIILTGTSFSFSNDNTLATIETGESATNYHSVWYEYVPLADGSLTLTKSAGVAVAINVYLGTTIPTLLSVGSGNNTVSVSVKAGYSYKIAIYGQISSTVGAYTITGVCDNEYLVKDTITSPNVGIAYSGNRIIVKDPFSRRIFIFSNGTPTVYYSDDGGVTWTSDHVFTGDISSTYNGISCLFLDENNNLLFCRIKNPSQNVYTFNVSKRDKITGAWTHYASSSMTEYNSGGGQNQTRWNMCQADDRTIHFVKTHVNSANSGSNIIYANYKTGVFSTPKLITHYNYVFSGSCVGQNNVEVVYHGGKILVFWRLRSTPSDTNGVCKYAEIVNDSLAIDADAGAGAWVTSRAYTVGDLVTSSNEIYICVKAHSSGTFSTDLASGNWAFLGSSTPATYIPGLDNNDIYTVRSCNGHLYFFNAASLNPTPPTRLYEDFIDITPHGASEWGTFAYQIWNFECAENGDLAVYGTDGSGGLGANGHGFVQFKLSGTWRTKHTLASLNGDFVAGHTYNFARFR